MHGMTTRCRDVDVRVRTAGVLVTLIDFTLSRLQLEGGDVVCCDLEADPEIFQGPKGDCQVCVWWQVAASLDHH